MSNSRNNFSQRLHALKLALGSDIIISRAPTEIDHNARALLFRNGLAVTSFAIIEDFIRTRTGEVLSRLGSSIVPFSELPDGIKSAATNGVINAMRFQERFLTKKSTDYFSFHQNHARSVASTSSVAGGYEISPLAFGHSQSNITADDVRGILSAFGIDNPWQSLGQIASRANVGVLDLKSSFENAAERRNKAAHRADAQIETSDLSSFTTDMLGIAIGFDLLISKALRKILDYDRDHLIQRVKLASSGVDIRYIIHNGTNGWREVVDPTRRAIARERDLAVLRVSCIRRALVNRQAVVVVGDRGLPMEWYTPEVD